MRFLVSGSTGLVGSTLSDHLTKSGHEVVCLVRSTSQNNSKSIQFDFKTGAVNLNELENFDVIIHLAGANISAQRWTPTYKDEIYKSRINSTRILAETIAKLKNKPKVFIIASAVGYYGPQSNNQSLDETSSPGSDFLSKVCQDWEKASKIEGIRVINLRFGMVISNKGGAMLKMLPIFKLGLGGNLGSGKQIYTWIAADEIPLVIDHVIRNTGLSGPINVVAPQTISNAEFTQSLGKVLSRPVIFPAPAFAIKLAFGEMGDVLLLSGARIIPKKLLDSGYNFRYPELEQTFKYYFRNDR